MREREERRNGRTFETRWWVFSALLVYALYMVLNPKPLFAGYNLWLEAVILWMQLAALPALAVRLIRLLPRPGLSAAPSIGGSERPRTGPEAWRAPVRDPAAPARSPARR